MDLLSVPPPLVTDPPADPRVGAAPHSDSWPDPSQFSAAPSVIEGDIVEEPRALTVVAGAVPTSQPRVDEEAPSDEEMAIAREAAPYPPAPGTINVAATASLTVKRGGLLTTEKFVFGQNAVLGRFDPGSGPVDVDLGPLPEAGYVSRHHAQIRRDENGHWLIKDGGSRNGTFVRTGEQGQFLRVVDEHVINDGDEVALGNARFEFHIGG
jgi:pSer/pThr/pTyr-binding forkhead associated (FHA) protein